MDELSTRALAFIRSRRLLEAGEGVLVGLSGGPDSVALVTILNELSASGALPLRLRLAHLHHGLRGEEADEDESFCRALAEELRLPIVTARVGVKREKRRGESLEEAARRVRYRFLLDAARADRLSAVALGHHGDDVAETVLMRMMRGCGLRGLGAMSASRPAGGPGQSVRIVRPLLELRRAELLEMLQQRGRRWRLDRSNLDRRFLRNRIRLDVLPALAKSCSGFSVESLCGLNSAAVELNASLDAALDEQWPALCVEAGAEAVALDAQRYARAAPALRKLAVRRAVACLLPDDAAQPALARDHYDAARDMADVPVGTALSLPGGLIAEREHGLVRIRRSSVVQHRQPVGLAVPGAAVVAWAGLTLGAETCEVPPGRQDSLLKRAGPRDVFVSAEALALPLTVRARTPGDRLRPLGAPGSRKLKDYFIDRKVPRHERDRTPLVVDARGRIVWVVGHVISEAFKLTGRERRAVHLSAR